jgi:hypothetical protein
MMAFHLPDPFARRHPVTYRIARDGQEFGPYSLSDVQRYVGTGNILPTDFALAEGSTEWIPVAQVVGTIAASAPQAIQPGYAPVSVYPEPPGLNWGIVLLLDVVTCGIFNIAWNIVQALWVKKVQPDTRALLLYLAALGLAAVNIAISVSRMITTMHAGGKPDPFAPLAVLSLLISLATFILQWILQPFEVRRALLKHFNESDPIGLQLNPVMTFFFGSLYFQYHLNRISDLKRAYNPANPY